MPPTPICKIRSLLFLLSREQTAHESEATPAAMMAPDLRKVLRVTGEPGSDVCFDFNLVIRYHAGMEGREVKFES